MEVRWVTADGQESSQPHHLGCGLCSLALRQQTPIQEILDAWLFWLLSTERFHIISACFFQHSSKQKRKTSCKALKFCNKFGTALSKIRNWPPHAARLMHQQQLTGHCISMAKTMMNYHGLLENKLIWCSNLSTMVRPGLNHGSFGRKSYGALQDLQLPSWSHSCAAGASAISW